MLHFVFAIWFFTEGVAAQRDFRCLTENRNDWYRFQGTITNRQGKFRFFREIVQGSSETYYWTDIVDDKKIFTGVFKPSASGTYPEESGILVPRPDYYDCERKNLPVEAVPHSGKYFYSCRMYQETENAKITVWPALYEGFRWYRIRIEFKDESKGVIEMNSLDSGCSPSVEGKS